MITTAASTGLGMTVFVNRSQQIVLRCFLDFPHCRTSMRFQISAPISQNGKADGMRFWKSVERKGCDRMQYFLNHLRRDLIARHRLAQFHTDSVHPLFRAMKAESTP